MLEALAELVDALVEPAGRFAAPRFGADFFAAGFSRCRLFSRCSAFRRRLFWLRVPALRFFRRFAGRCFFAAISTCLLVGFGAGVAPLDYLNSCRFAGLGQPVRTAPAPGRGRRGAGRGRRAAARAARAARRPAARATSRPRDEQVVDRAGRGRGGEAEALAQLVEDGGSSAGRRLRSPPKSSGASPAHSVAGSRREQHVRRRPARAGRWSRAGWRRRAPEAVRVKAIARRSGSPSWIASSRRSAIPPSACPAHGRGPGSGWSRPRRRRSGPGSGGPASARSGAERVARGQHPVRLGPAGPRQRRRRSAAGTPAAGRRPSRRRRAARRTRRARSRLTWTWVSLRSSIRSSRERQVQQLRVGREVAPVEEVPGDRGELHARRSIRCLKRGLPHRRRARAPSSWASCSTGPPS